MPKSMLMVGGEAPGVGAAIGHPVGRPVRGDRADNRP